MVSWYIRRVTQAILTIIAAASLTFFLIRFLPGGPVDYLRAQLAMEDTMNTQQLSQLLEAYAGFRPDEPLHVQYIDYVTSLAQGDFGTSVRYQKPVINVLMDGLPWTVFVMSISVLLSFLLGISVGAYMAYRQGSLIDSSLTSIFVVQSSVPYYIVAFILLFALAYEIELFPTRGRLPSGVDVGLSLSFFLGALHHATLPILSNVSRFGGRAIAMRGNSIRVLGEDYMRVARLRGLPVRRITIRYVARNAVLPMYTSLMLAIGAVFGGSVILETIFTYPGVGYIMFQGIASRDYPLMMGAFLLITVVVVIGILIADITYGKLDPRAGTGDGHESY